MTAPILGAALRVADLADFRNWLFEKDRDLELSSFTAPALLASGEWAPLVEEARRQLDGFRGRLGIHGPFWGLDIANPDPEIRRLITRRMLTGLDICAALSASHMVIHSPYKTWDHHNIDLVPETRGRLLEAVHDTMAPVVARAGEIGVTLMVENIEDVNPEDRKRLVESFGGDVLKVSLDTGHAHYAHCVTGAPPVDLYVRSAGDRLGHVHLQDSDGYADRHWAIGQGSIAWHAVFAALSQIAAHPRLILELRDKAGIVPSAQWLAAQGLAQ